MSTRDQAELPARLRNLLGFLNGNSTNKPLIEDTAIAAFDAGLNDLAAQLLDQYAALDTLPAKLLNLKGLLALASHDPGSAAQVFEELRTRDADNPALKFNLAWAKAMTGAWREALDLLDDSTLGASPRAPSLKIHVMHHLSMYDEALATGANLAEKFPADQALMGALATLALDAGKADLARGYAQKSGTSPEGRAAQGFIALGDHENHRALALFEEAIAEQPINPRAWIGKGLGLLADGRTAEGSSAIDRGAEMFGDHIGSWIASGWAHFVRGDNAAARRSFERALAIDANFSECHGGLAVMDIADGHVMEAERRCEIALRLDRRCFGAALAKTLLLAGSGRHDLAQKVRDKALATPVGQRGETIADLLVQMGARAGR
jgi:tetratricopeptide (TPR) repeat protein